MTQTISTAHLKDHAATEQLAKKISMLCKPGDTIALVGDIGSGKTTFARAFIRCFLGSEIDVPSPTFTIVQIYGDPPNEIWHCDLYRLTDPDEAIELGLEEAFENCIVLVEWPDRLGSILPPNALRLSLKDNGVGRTVEMSGGRKEHHKIISLNA